MQDETWIKTYRKIAQNYVYIYDSTGWRVFFHLLITVNWKTGKRTLTVNQLAKELRGLKESTVYQALRRLNSQHQMIEIKSDNQKSTISICNWGEYQNLVENDIEPPLKTKRKRLDNAPDQKERNNIRSNNKEIVTPSGLLTVLKAFEEKTGKQVKPQPLVRNYTHWEKIYTPEEISRALVLGLDTPGFWKDKLTPELLLRQQNEKGENVDRIGQFLLEATPAKRQFKPEETLTR